MKLTKSTLMVLATFAGLSYAQAASIALTNASFGDTPTRNAPGGSSPNTALFNSNDYNAASAINGWGLAETAGNNFTYALVNSSFASITGFDADGQGMWIVGAAVAEQQTSTNFISGETYTFTIAAANTSASANTFDLEIFDDNGVLAILDDQSVAGGASALSDFSVDYLATGSEVGNIGVRITNATGVGNILVFDNARLSTTAVPEPSSTALLGLGGLALIMRRRK